MVAEILCVKPKNVKNTDFHGSVKKEERMPFAGPDILDRKEEFCWVPT
jgi:hypothetical protein